VNSFEEVNNWINSQIPNYQKDGVKAYKPNLNKMNLFNDFLGNPDKNFKKIHISGTNGKGSTAHLISSLLQ
jgi:dihydrofolate synthase/folylpolyglutamate synthase